MSDKTSVPVDDGIWTRMMRRYAIAVLAGMGLLVYVVPSMQGKASSTPEMVMLLVGGLLFFGGLFGILVALFFYLWHRKG